MAHYKITVLEFGFLPGVTGDFVYDGFYGMGPNYYHPFTMTLLQGEGHNILFDTGFNANNPAKYERFVTVTGGQNAHGSDELLAAVGLKPEDIDTVVLSHIHWDHAGATELYPNAHFYIQKEEMDSWEKLLARPQFSWACWLNVDAEDLQKLKALQENGRLTLLDGEMDDLLDGIHVRVSKDAHSCAMQMLLVDNEQEGKGTIRYVLAADAYNRPDSLFGPQTPGGGYVPAKKFNTGSAFNSIETMIRIYDWSEGDPSRAVTAHDGSMMERFPNEVSALGLHIIRICE